MYKKRRINRSTYQTSFDVHFMENIIVQRASFRLCEAGGVEAWCMMQKIRGADGKAAVIKASRCEN